MADPDVHVDWAEDPKKDSNMSQNSDNNEKLRPKKWHIEDDILYFNNQQYIPPGLLRHKLLKLHHNDSWVSHFGHEQMLELLRCNYYWRNMATNVKKYVESYSTCRWIKPTRHLLYGELQSFLLPMGPRQDWIMDFITGLPLSKLIGIIFNAILVVVDRYTKFARYILSREDWKAKTLGDALIREVWSKCGLPVSLTTDRGSLFTSKYRSQICYLRIWLGYSTAFHPQTDGQTEHQNQTLEQYLQDYVNYQQNDWPY